MKNIFKKNQMIITALAIMIAVAGYLNYSGSKLDSANIHLVKEIVVNDLCMYFIQVGAVTRREH